MSDTEETINKIYSTKKINTIGGISIIHKKTKAIRKQLAAVTPISQWSSLSLAHDNIDQDLDKLLIEAIQSLHYDSQVTRKSSRSLKSNMATNILDHLAAPLTTAAATVSGVGTSANNTSTSTSASTANINQAVSSTQSPLTSAATDKDLINGVDSLLATLNGLAPLYSDDGNAGAKNRQSFLAGGRKKRQGATSGGDYDPSLTYKVGKQFLMANLLVDQIQMLVDYLFVASQRIGSVREYWMSRYTDSPNSWYIIEKSPWFWVRYWRQELKKKIRFERKLARLHQSSNYTSPFITISNQINTIRVEMERFVRRNILKHSEEELDNFEESCQPSPSSSEEVSPVSSDDESNVISGGEEGEEDEEVQSSSHRRRQHNKHQFTTTTAANRNSSSSSGIRSNEILHPTKEIELRINKLDRLLKLISTAIGRLTYYLGNMRNFNTLSQFNVISSQAVILIYDTVLMFGANIQGGEMLQGDDELNHDVNYHINQLVEMSKMIQDRMQDYGLLTNSILSDCSLIDQPDNEKYIESLYFMVKSNTVAIQKFIGFMQLQIQLEQPPRWLSRNWMKVGATALAFYFSGHYFYENYADFKSSAIDYYHAWRRFSSEHIEGPLRNIWNVIRYDQKTMNVADPASLRASLESLQRMVVDYNRDTQGGQLSNSDIEQLIDLAAKGDITTVMKPYEASIEKPLKNLVLGDLLRLILIQVQKEKVDVDKAMQAIDKLLQANELNFQLLAAIPSVLIVGAIGWQINQFVRGEKNSAKVIRAQSNILSELRSMHRQLTIGKDQVLPGYLSPLVMASPSTYFSTFYPGLKNIQYSNNNNNNNSNNINNNSNYEYTSEEDLRLQCVPFEQYGTLLLTTDKLKQYIQHINNKIENQWLTEDLQDLESDHLGNNEKILTIQRMFYTYSFLKK